MGCLFRLLFLLILPAAIIADASTKEVRSFLEPVGGKILNADSILNYRSEDN